MQDRSGKWDTVWLLLSALSVLLHQMVCGFPCPSHSFDSGSYIIIRRTDILDPSPLSMPPCTAHQLRKEMSVPIFLSSYQLSLPTDYSCFFFELQCFTLPKDKPGTFLLSVIQLAEKEAAQLTTTHRFWYEPHREKATHETLLCIAGYLFSL